eukprot:CAMPEP_0171833270 /NCGR_PEP_ID=MMETSP0992-20121227/9801_1 /TAXON_ID=483369 /ORGANISM="non described non described, Strain CCMP2098" /LENGTH=393 /DNA_ID=CAMNT_0012448897 /DNA_START=38 /DNA_END=1219 /DNA_ORIENTATION=-
MGNCSGGDKKSKLPFNESYEVMNQIGEGSTALVFKVRRKTAPSSLNDLDEEILAVKVMDKSKFSPEDLGELLKEAEYLRELNHRSIIKIHDFYNDSSDKSYMVLELVSGGDVFERLEEKTVYSEPAARSLIRNLMEALKHMHGKGIAHRDIKLAALMLREKKSDSEVVLMDFGLAARTGGPRKRPLTDECGTPGYAAPEVLKCGPYGVECDIWSTGVLAFTLLGGYPPFHSEDEAEVFAKTTGADFTFDPEFWAAVTPAAKEFIASLLVVSQDKRPTAEECLQSVWLSSKYDDTVAEADVKRQRKAAAAKRKSNPAAGGGKPRLSSGRGAPQRKSAPAKSSAASRVKRKTPTPPRGGGAPSKVNNALFSATSSQASSQGTSRSSSRNNSPALT